MKSGVEQAAASYLENISAYEEARKCFDSYMEKSNTVESQSSKHQSRLADLSLNVLISQNLRDESESQYVELLARFKPLLQESDALRKSLDPGCVASLESEFACLSHIDTQLKSEDEIANRTRVELNLAKCNYRGIMLRLQEVSRDARLLNAAKTPTFS